MAVTTIGEAIRSILINTAGIAALIGARCYPEPLPQNPEYPCIVYDHISGTPDNHLLGSSTMIKKRYQVDVYAKTRTAAWYLAGLVRVALNQYSGTVGTVRIGSCLQIGEQDMYEPEIECHKVMLDFSILHDD